MVANLLHYYLGKCVIYIVTSLSLKSYAVYHGSDRERAHFVGLICFHTRLRNSDLGLGWLHAGFLMRRSWQLHQWCRKYDRFGALVPERWQAHHSHLHGCNLCWCQWRRDHYHRDVWWAVGLLHSQHLQNCTACCVYLTRFPNRQCKAW